MPEAAKASQAVRQLSTPRLKQAEYTFNVYVAELEVGTSEQNLLDEGFWAHVSAKLKPWDFVVGRVEDGSHIYFLVVLSAGRNFAKMKVLGHHDLQVTAPDVGGIPSGLEVKWGGPHARFRVVRGTDVMKEHFETREQANQWARNHALK